MPVQHFNKIKRKKKKKKKKKKTKNMKNMFRYFQGVMSKYILMNLFFFCMF